MLYYITKVNIFAGERNEQWHYMPERKHVMKTGGEKYYEDNLVARFRFWEGTGFSYRFQGKRVASSCPLDDETRRIYVSGGTIAAVKHLRNNSGLSLRECMDLIRLACGKRHIYNWGPTIADGK